MLRPVLVAAEASTHLVNRMRREELRPQGQAGRKDELAALAMNLKIIGMRLPALVEKQEADAEPVRFQRQLAHHLQSCHSQQEVLHIAVTEALKLLNVDRVGIFYYHGSHEGRFIEEAVSPGWPKVGHELIFNPPVRAEDVDLDYNTHRVRALENLYEADLPEAQVNFLSRLQVQAELVAPILQQNHCWGLLIAHQCSAPRRWQQSEVDLWVQLAMLIGFALDNTSLREQVTANAKQAQQYAAIAHRIRVSLNTEDILNTTVDDVHKILKCDRVIVLGFRPDWTGTVLAESVRSGVPKTGSANLEDSCFADERLVEQYEQGLVRVVHDISAAGLRECFLRQLEYFKIKAYIAAPILVDRCLFGILIAHQCSEPRRWQQTEISLCTQVAIPGWLCARPC